MVQIPGNMKTYKKKIGTGDLLDDNYRQCNWKEVDFQTFYGKEHSKKYRNAAKTLYVKNLRVFPKQMHFSRPLEPNMQT